MATNVDVVATTPMLFWNDNTLTPPDEYKGKEILGESTVNASSKHRKEPTRANHAAPMSKAKADIPTVASDSLARMHDITDTAKS